MSTYKTNKSSDERAAVFALAPRSTSSRSLTVLPTALVAVFCAVCATAVLGCNRRSSPDRAQAEPERPWHEQLASVRAGTSDEIRLEHTPVSSAELAELTGLTGLHTLILDAGVVRDEDAPTIAALSGLEHLRLRESPLSDRGLAQLAQGQLDSLIILNLPQATPTAAGLEQLAKLPHVRQLRIGGRQIDDEAVAVLAKWPELTSLHLIGPGITEKSLQTIAGMPELISFYLDDCELSDSAWEEFFRARPGLHVHIDQAHHDRDPNADH